MKIYFYKIIYHIRFTVAIEDNLFEHLVASRRWVDCGGTITVNEAFITEPNLTNQVTSALEEVSENGSLATAMWAYYKCVSL